MKTLGRIIVVWPLSLLLGTLTLLIGGTDGLGTMLLIYGLIMTPFAIVGCLIAKALEQKIGGWAGISLMVGFPILLFLIAPNKSNAMAGLGMAFPIIMLTGILWSISYIVFRDNRSS